MTIKKNTRISGIPIGFHEQIIRLDDVDINYVEGPANGLPLLLIPGQMESWQGYKLVMPELSRHFHVFVPDLRGHGKSSRTPGKYSYSICGNDLALFIRQVIGKQVIVAGLSSGAVLALWLGANLPDFVLGVISEDPPIYSSIWPRIAEEKFMTLGFQNAIDAYGGQGKRGLANLDAYLSHAGIPAKGKTDLLYIPKPIVKYFVLLGKLALLLHPERPYDVPLLPFNLRAGYKFMMEYDTDFSQATIDGRLSAGFNPDATLTRISCPVLLLHASAMRDPYWGLLGAMDENDVNRMKTLVNNLKVVEVKSGHEMHMLQPKRYVNELITFVDECLAGSV